MNSAFRLLIKGSTNHSSLAVLLRPIRFEHLLVSGGKRSPFVALSGSCIFSGQDDTRTHNPWFVCFDERFSLFVDLFYSFWSSEVLDDAATILFNGADNSLEVVSWDALDVWFSQSHINKCSIEIMGAITNDR
jgi:hypothetical protein